MAASAGVSVTGLSRVTAAVRKLGVDVYELRGAWEPIGRASESAIKSAAPTRTGALQGSVRSSKMSSGVKVRIGGTGGVNYAGYVIFGVPSKGMAPNLFPYEALDSLPLESMAQDAVAKLIMAAGLRG